MEGSASLASATASSRLRRAGSKILPQVADGIAKRGEGKFKIV
jgi:hypothetical protein